MAQYKAVSVTGDNRGFMQGFGNAVILRDTVAPSAALALNDTIDLIRIPGGTKLYELTTFNGDLDTGTTLQFKLGFRRAQSDGVLTEDDDYFGSALTTWQAAVLQSAATRWAFTDLGGLYFAEDVFITATITAAATGVSGTPAITVTAHGEATGKK